MAINGTWEATPTRPQNSYPILARGQEGFNKDEQKNNIIGKLMYGDVINDIKSVLGNWSIGFCIYDFADRKFPFKNNKQLQRNI